MVCNRGFLVRGDKLFITIRSLIFFFIFFDNMIFNTAHSPSMQLVFSNDIAEVWKNEVTGQSALYARKDFQAGDKFNEVGASAILKSPSYLTVQKDTDEHICLHPQF